MINDAFASQAYADRLDYNDAIDSWFLIEADEKENDLIVCIAKNRLHRNESRSFEVVSYKDNKDGHVIAHVADKAMADWIATNYKG